MKTALLIDLENDMQKRKPNSAFKFTIRLLFLLFLILGLTLRFWALPALRQKRIAQWVSMQRGDVAYQEELVATERNGQAEYGLIKEMLGVDFVDRIASVSLKTAGDMTELSGLPYLRYLSIGQYGGPDLSGLEGMVELESLTINESGKVDLAVLERLPSLSYLAFTNSKTENFVPLRNLNALTYLDLYGSQMSDVNDLEHLTQLEWLFLPDFANQLVDISPLKKLVNLRHLCLYKSCFSEEHYQELKSALPDCHIEFYPSDD